MHEATYVQRDHFYIKLPGIVVDDQVPVIKGYVVSIFSTGVKNWWQLKDFQRCFSSSSHGDSARSAPWPSLID
eukprot:8158001-Lingulodinium_polyedra.AAC.1